MGPGRTIKLKLKKANGKKFACKFCENRKFYDEKAIDLHFEDAHKDKTAKCSICCNRFNRQNDLDTHKPLCEEEKKEKNKAEKEAEEGKKLEENSVQ
jgi:hypothetical protein